MAKRKTDPTRKRFQGGGKVQGKARSLANKNDLQLALALNQVREARSRSIPLGREDDLASYLGSLSNNELAQLQRATEARQGVKQALGPNVPLLDRAVGVGNTASNLVFDALKSTGLLPLAGRGYDWVTGGTQGAELTTSSPGTSTDQWGNIKATLQGVGQGLGDVGSALGLPSVARPAASRFSVTSPPGTAGFIRGQTGGQVPSKPNSFIRVPAKDIIKAQRGLQVPSGNIRGNQGISSQTPTQSNVVGQTIDALGQIKPDTSQLSATAGKLAGFNPLAGAAGSTLQGIISTGSPVDVSPITQVAQQQAARTYGDLSGGINEQLGALNLGSSTARTNALAREAGRLAQGVGETGILAGVQAQEAARGRQLAAFNPLLGASGQQLSGLQAAGGLQGEAAQLGLQGQIAKAGGFGNLSGQLIPPTVGVNQQPPPRAFGGSGASGTGFGRRPSFGFGESMGRMAAGGRVDMGDYLANLTFGQQFTRPEAVPQAPMRTREYQPTVTRQGQPMFNPKDLMSQSRSARPDYIAQYVGDQMRRGGFNPLGFGGYSMTNALKQAAFSSPGGGSAGLSFEGVRRTPTRTASNREFEQAARQYQFFINQGINPLTGRRIDEKAEGGIIPGPAVPPDQVPILAQGGEGIIPVKAMHRLENAKTTKQLAAVAREIQQIMQREPQLNDRDIQRKQRGGKIAKVMGEFKAGTLRSGGPNGPVVKDRKQAIAIALSEAREAGQEPKQMARGGRAGNFSAMESTVTHSGMKRPPSPSRPEPRFQPSNPFSLYDPQGFRRGSAESRQRYQHQSLTAPAIGSSSDEMMRLIEYLRGVPQLQHGGSIPTNRQRDFRGAQGTLTDPYGSTYGAVQSQGSQTPTFAVPQQAPEEPEDVELRAAQHREGMARARSTLLKALATNANPAVLSKLAPLVAQAEQDELASTAGVNEVMARKAVKDQQIQMAQQAQMERESAERQEAIRAQGLVESRQAQAQGLGGFLPPTEGTPPPAAGEGGAGPQAPLGPVGPERIARMGSPQARAEAEAARAPEMAAEARNRVLDVLRAAKSNQAQGFNPGSYLPPAQRQELLASVGMSPLEADTLLAFDSGDPDQVEAELRQLGAHEVTPETQAMAQSLIDQMGMAGVQFNNREQREYAYLIALAAGF